MRGRGATLTSLRISAAINPPCSATPAPSNAISVMASTPKPWKFGTNDVKMNRMPSMLSRGRIAMVVCRIS